jgi:hypothetical protein
MPLVVTMCAHAAETADSETPSMALAGMLGKVPAQDVTKRQ